MHEMGIEVVAIQEGEAGGIDLSRLLRVLGQRGITSVLVEGGAGVITSLLRLNLADRLVVFVAPRIMGRGVEAVGELNIKEVSHALSLSFTRIHRLGPDFIVEARVNPPSQDG